MPAIVCKSPEEFLPLIVADMGKRLEKEKSLVVAISGNVNAGKTYVRFLLRNLLRSTFPNINISHFTGFEHLHDYGKEVSLVEDLLTMVAKSSRSVFAQAKAESFPHDIFVQIIVPSREIWMPSVRECDSNVLQNADYLVENNDALIKRDPRDGNK